MEKISKNLTDAKKILLEGKVAVIPTDTIYGLSSQALSETAVEKIYQIKQRKTSKPMIILIADIEDLALFGIETDEKVKKILEKVWPGKVSAILPCSSAKFHYLHRGANTLAFRLPARADLRELIKATGPLISTSANLERSFPASTIEEVKKYFGGQVNIYIDEGRLNSIPSTLIWFKNGEPVVLRQGEVKIEA